MSQPDPSAGDMPAGEPPVAVPAATLVVFRHDPRGGPPELLLVRRSAAMAFAGGAAVFPGGKVDPADRELAAQTAADGDDADDLAARIAAIRETIEETGLVTGVAEPVDADEAAAARAMLGEVGSLAPVLATFGWTLAPARLVPFARWCPPVRAPRVFDTRFYLVDIGTGAVELAVDATENTHLFWASAEQALRLGDSGAIRVIFPTRRNLERLALFADFAAARAHAEAVPVRMILPWREERDGTTWLRIPEDCGYPITAAPLPRAPAG